MKNISDFIQQSKTFNGFVFDGNYDMPIHVFCKIYDIYQKHCINLLDDYSQYIYCKWLNIDKRDEFWDKNKCDEVSKSLSLLLDYKIINKQLYLEQYIKVTEMVERFNLYLYKSLNIDRKIACTYTSRKAIKHFIYNLYGKKCLCCGSDKNITLDHIIPVKKGGLNSIDNLQPLCKSCNSRKSTNIIDYRNE